MVLYWVWLLFPLGHFCATLNLSASVFLLLPEPFALPTHRQVLTQATLLNLKQSQKVPFFNLSWSYAWIDRFRCQEARGHCLRIISVSTITVRAPTSPTPLLRKTSSYAYAILPNPNSHNSIFILTTLTTSNLVALLISRHYYPSV